MSRPAVLLQRAFVGLSATWAAALAGATAAASQPMPGHATYLFALAVYAIGAAVCHQLPERSFHVWGRQMPVCARCTGIYLGAAVAGIPLLGARHRRRSAEASRSSDSRAVGARRFSGAFVTVLALLLNTATLVYEWTTGIAPSNTIRFAAGAILGAAVAWLVADEVN